MVISNVRWKKVSILDKWFDYFQNCHFLHRTHDTVFRPNMTLILKKRAHLSVYFYKTSKHLKNKPQELNEKRKFGNFLQPIMAFTFSIFILFWQRSDFYKKKCQIITFQYFWENLEMTLKPPNDTKIDENRGFRI